LRVKKGGGLAGHNGLHSLAAHIGTGFRRIRLGIGHPGKEEVLRHVLRDFAKADDEWLIPLLNAMAEAAPLLVHNETDWTIAMLLSNFTYQDEFPNPIGVFYSVDEPIYEVMLAEQIEFAKKNKGIGDIQTLLDGADNWVVE